ncbi:MAG: hypothetical protein AAF267_02125 [Deinococcota bacterium]
MVDVKKARASHHPSVLIAGFVFNGSGMLFFSYLFYTRYWQHRECIEAALSSCLVNSTNLTEGGMVWSVPAAVFVVSTLVVLVKMLKNGARASNTLAKQR